MAAEADVADDVERDDQEIDDSTSTFPKELATSQAEAVIMRDIDLRERVDDVLRDLEADMRSEPARLTEKRLDALDDVIGDLMLFSNDLRKLDRRDDDA